MSAQRNAANRGIGPLLSGVGIGSPRTGHLRVSDAERQAVADRLAEHYGEGRLDQSEFDERVGQAMGAKTQADLAGLFDDLPEPGSVSGPAGAPGARSDGARSDGARSAGAWSDGAAEPRGVPKPPHVGRRHGRWLPIALIFVLAIVATHAVHAIFWFTVPWLWLAFVAVVVLAVTGHLGRR